MVMDPLAQHADPGCASAREYKWAEHRVAATPLIVPDGPIVVVVPHPDDETLATGGLLQHAQIAGIPVLVVAVTDGEQAYGSNSARSMRLRRPAEQHEALGVLAPNASIVRLGLPDGRVAEFESSLTTTLDRIAPPDATVVAPWVHDHHCDHEAVGRAAANAVGVGPDRRLLASLFWAWHRTDPCLLGDDQLAFLELGDDRFTGRRSALQAHRSQLRTTAHASPVLGDAELTPMRWQREFYVL